MTAQPADPVPPRAESFGARIGDGAFEALVPLIPLLYMVRVLEPAELGYLGLALAGASLCRHLIALRAETAVGGADGPDSPAAARDRAVVLAVAITGLGVIALGSLALALRLPDFALVFALAPILAAIRFVAALDIAGVVDEGRIARHRLIGLSGNVTGLVLTVGLISGLGLGWSGRILALVVAEGGIVALRSAVRAGMGRGPGLAWDIARARVLIAAACPAFAAGILVFALDHGARLLALGTLTMADVGYFVVAHRVGSSIATINRSLAFALSPRVKERLDARRLGELRRLHVAYGAALLGLAGALALAAYGLTPWVFGAAYAAAAPLAAIVTLGYGAQGFQRVGGIVRTRLGLAAPSPWHLAVALAVNMAVSLALVGGSGAAGIAIGSAAGFAVMALLSSATAYRALAAQAQ